MSVSNEKNKGQINEIDKKKTLSNEEKERLIRAYERKMKKGSDYRITNEKKKTNNDTNLCDTHWDGA